MVRILAGIARVPAQTIMALIRIYQVLSSPFPPSCRFTPSCSAYAMEAIRTHGAIRGVWLGALRIGRCHPFSRGGADPVPEK